MPVRGSACRHGLFAEARPALPFICRCCLQVTDTPDATASPAQRCCDVARLHFAAGRHIAAITAADEGARLAAEAAEARVLAHSLQLAGNARVSHGLHLEAARNLEQALRLSTAQGDRPMRSRVLANLGYLTELLCGPRAALPIFLEAWRAADTGESGALAALNCGGMLADIGEMQAARGFCEAGLALAPPSSRLAPIRPNAMAMVGWIRAAQGELEEGEALAIRGINEAIAFELPVTHMRCLGWLAKIVLFRGQPHRAVTLCEQALTLLDAGAAVHQRGEIQRVMAQALQEQGAWERAAKLLQALYEQRERSFASVDDAEARVLLRQLARAFDASPASPSRGRQPSRLSLIERQLLALVAAGLSNRQIAVQTGKSPNTIRNQLATLIHRLGVATRASAVAKAMTLGLIEPLAGVAAPQVRR